MRTSNFWKPLKLRRHYGKLHISASLPVVAVLSLVLAIGGYCGLRLISYHKHLSALESQLASLPIRASLSAVEEPGTSEASSSFPTQASETERELEISARLKLFSEEYNRVKKYEEQIQKRVESLDSLLNKVSELEHSSTGKWISRAKKWSSEKRFLSSAKKRTGLGGGEKPKVPVIHAEGSGNSKPRSPTLVAPEKVDISLKADESIRVYLLLNELDKRIFKLAGIPMGSPVQADFSSGFGRRVSPFGEGMQFHSGIDFSAEPFSPVLATADGWVSNAGYKGSYGKTVVLLHPNGIETIYAHLSKVEVRLGQKVKRGDRLGTVGSTGRSTGPHLHYEVRQYGYPKNPLPYVELAAIASKLVTN